MARILCTVTTDISFDQRMQRICTTLQEAGHDVTLIGRRLPTTPTTDSFKFKTKRFKNIFKAGKLFYFEHNVRLFYYLLFSRFDILCAVDLDTLVPAYISASIKGKPLVYDAHEYFPEQPQVKSRKFSYAIWSTVEKWIVPKLKHAYTVNHSLAQLFSEKYNTSFGVITNAAVKGEPITPSKEAYFIYTGWVDPHRGLEELIEAAPMLKLPLVIVGDGLLLEKLKRRVAELKIEDKVAFTGFLPPKELRAKAQDAFAGFLLAENLGVSYYYALGNKFFDYVQGGIPQICIDFPEYRHLEEKHNLSVLVNTLTPDVIANAANSLIEDPALFQKLKFNTIKAQDELSWEKQEQLLVDFYDNLS